jgi:Uma2 family endonuclease
MSATSHNVTATQLAALADDGVRYELVKGELRMMSPAGGRHGWIASRLNRLLGNHVVANRLGAVFAAETGFLISTNPDTVRAPDVAFVSAEQMARIDDLDGYLPLAPDLAAEVVSPNDSSSEVEAKAAMWIEAGTAMVLVVDPANQSVRVYRSRSAIQVLYPGDRLDAGEVIQGWTLAVSELFSEG